KLAYISTIIVAAGKGNRMGTRLPKQFLKIENNTILYHTLDQFATIETIDEIIVVVAREYLDSEILQASLPSQLQSKQVKLIAGGSSRQESVGKGLNRLDERTDIVVVHDGVRPFVTQTIIEKNIEQCRTKDAILTAFPVTDTLKEIKRDHVIGTLDREKIWSAQTPQTFKTELLKAAYEKAIEEDLQATDEAGLMEKYQKVHVIRGDKHNFKITHKEDLLLARALYQEKTNDL
ncbi:MAG: 2-C-methyl-D-erythritol 4-phosphate cytidylyltransferase, partial [Candidatus Marinimicrobia bacterium]|nr:2-C-methyl-D-erythritol 4-phosphate cytidylyltransferase [Candidatus Neomarinimicrobiota bacterium]